MQPKRSDNGRTGKPVAFFSAGEPTKTAARVVLILALTLVAYIPAMRAGFVWDDDTFLTKNPLIKASDGLYRFWFTTEPPDYFPLTSTMLWLEWRLWGEHPAGYHVINIMLHAASAVLVWRVLLRLRVPGAWWSAVIFAVHPVNVESVAWITERKNTLPMVFYLLTLVWFLRYQAERRRLWHVLSVAAFLLALFGKTSVVMLPLVLLGCVWWLRGRVSRKDVLDSMPFFILAGTLSLVTIWFQYHRAIGSDIVRDDGFPGRLAGAGCAVWFYLYKALLPRNLSFVYPRWHIDPSSVLSFVPLLLLMGFMGILWRYRKMGSRPALFAMGYYIVTLFPVLGFFNIYFMRYSLVADHWQYFSIIGIIALVVGTLHHHFLRRQGPHRLIGGGVACGVVGLLSVLTWRQASTYTDLETLYRDTLVKNPQCFMAHNNLGSLLEKQGDLDRAKSHYVEALRIKPDFPQAHNNLASMLAAQGRIDQAITHYQEAIRLKPDYADAYNNLGVALGRKGDIVQAVAHYAKALQIQPDHVEAHYNLAVALDSQGQADKAVAQYAQTLRFDPGHAKAHNNLGLLLARMGRAAEAIEHYQQASNLKPDWPEPLNNLAWLLATHRDARSRNGVTAVQLASRACAMTRNEQPEFLDTLAAALAAAGRCGEALSTIEKAKDLARTSGRQNLVEQLQQRSRFYASSRPFHEGAP